MPKWFLPADPDTYLMLPNGESFPVERYVDNGQFIVPYLPGVKYDDRACMVDCAGNLYEADHRGCFNPTGKKLR